MRGEALKPTFEKKFILLLKKLSGGSQISPTRRQSKARNFETAQHIDKQKYTFHLHSTINALKTVPNLGASPHGVLMQREN